LLYRPLALPCTSLRVACDPPATPRLLRGRNKETPLAGSESQRGLTKTARERFDRQLAEKLPDIFTALFEAGTKEKDTAALSLLVNRAVPDGIPARLSGPSYHSSDDKEKSGTPSGRRQNWDHVRTQRGSC
jgi:hypothetical protein